MADYAPTPLELTRMTMRIEIENYSMEHPNDFGVNTDGRDRIPMKKLMKIFGIKKKTAPDTQNKFRQYVNDICDLEVLEGIGKVLVLKEYSEGYDEDDLGDSTNDEPDYGYGEAAPDVSSSNLGFNHKGPPARTKSDDELMPIRRGTGGSGKNRAGYGDRKLPPHTASGGLSVATAESVGVYDDQNQGSRRTGYRRRGSVTRYSIVGHETVVQEYKKHEDVINQFRRDSFQIEKNLSLRNLQIGSESNHSQKSKHSHINAHNNAEESKTNTTDECSSKGDPAEDDPLASEQPPEVKQPLQDGKSAANALTPKQTGRKERVKRFLRGSRFSLAF